MNYAWVIDQTKCIGCHACSTACKSENDVPLGVYRTWVKNVEVGTFPNVRRHFAVLRCNHCADPPCVHICPVRAMYQRRDGIVDIDHDRCIGCKACMQACPYDAIHIDPENNTAAKCHFCAHRVDRGLLPACVVVCPVEALVFGDLDDPASRVQRLTGSTPVSVRRPEQGTRPKAFYIGAHEATLDPLAAAHDNTYMWADRVAGTAKDATRDTSLWAPPGHAGTRKGNKRSRRPARSRMPPARVAYDVPHATPWGGRVSGYLWTKAVSAGAAFLAALSMMTGGPGDTLHARGGPLVAMVALAATGLLLIADLKRPERFWYILAKPQWGSWLTRGAYAIAVFGALLTIWIAMPFLGYAPPRAFLGLVAVSAVIVAVYTAWLFGQCEGRDLWQSPMLIWTLALQMVVAGAGALLLAAVWLPTAPGSVAWLETMLLVGVLGHFATVAFAEATARHGSSNAAAAARLLVKGRHATLFWTSVVAGTAMPAALLALTPAGGVAGAVAAGLALAGLLAYEHVFVMAGQAVPIS